MKKIVSILLAFCLLITAAVPAFAVTTKAMQPDQTFNFKTKKDFSNWFIENRYTSAFAKEIIENKGYYLSTNPSPDESDEPNDIYRLSSDTFDDINGYYHIFLSPEGIPNLPRITLCLALLPDGVNDLEYAFKTFTPGIYDQYKNAKTVLTEETYNGKEMICWIRESPIPDERPGDFLSCVFIDNGYLVAPTALYTKEDMTWTNEFLDYFELEKVYIGDEFEKKIADVSANRKIGIEDALLVLQYSIGMIRKFPTHSYNKNYSGCMAPDRIAFYNEYGKKEVTNWFSDLAKEDSLPVMFERLEENGGFPYFSSSNELYKKYYFTFYNYDFTAEYPLIVCEYWDEINLYPFDTAHWSYLFTATFTDKNHDRDLESELASLYFSTYSDVMKYGEFKPGNVGGIDYLYWDGVDDKLSPGFVFEKDGYFIYFKGENPEQNIKDFKIDLIPINENLKDKPLMQRYGDVNRDNKIDASDALRILQYSVGIVDKVLCKEPEPKPEDPDTNIDDWDGVTECIITCRVCNRNQWMRPRDGLPGGWIRNDDMSYTCPDCK